MKNVINVSWENFQSLYNGTNKELPDIENKSMVTLRELHALKMLWEMVKPEIALEIGIRKGFTSQYLINNSPWLKKYIGIDVPENYVTTLESQRTEVKAIKGMYVENKEILDLRILPKGSQSINSEELPEIDFIFIDGDHSLEGVLNDSLLAKAVVKKGGVICWHDYKNVKSVSEAITYINYKFNWHITCIEDTCLCYLINS